LELHGKIVAGLIYVDSNSDHGQVWRVLLRAHFHQYAGYFAPAKLNVVGQLNHRLEAKFRPNDIGNRFDDPYRESPRIAELDVGP